MIRAQPVYLTPEEDAALLAMKAESRRFWKGKRMNQCERCDRFVTEELWPVGALFDEADFQLVCNGCLEDYDPCPPPVILYEPVAWGLRQCVPCVQITWRARAGFLDSAGQSLPVWTHPLGILRPEPCVYAFDDLSGIADKRKISVRADKLQPIPGPEGLPAAVALAGGALGSAECGGMVIFTRVPNPPGTLSRDPNWLTQRGTWSYLWGPAKQNADGSVSNEGKLCASLCCPGCGNHTGLYGNHTIDAEGKISPSVVCAHAQTPGVMCSFHEFVQLAGWDPAQAPPDDWSR